MSYRLKSMAVGNLLLIYSGSSGSDKVTETLVAVERVTPVNDDGEELAYDLVGIEKSPYGGFTWSTRTVTTSQDLKFAPLSRVDADRWLATHQVGEKLAKELEAARTNLRNLELKCENFSHYLMAEAPAELEGVAS